MSDIDFQVDRLPPNPRIDAYLARLYTGRYSRQEVKQALCEGRILLNGRAAKPRDLVKIADRISGSVGSCALTAQASGAKGQTLDIVYEDRDVAVINKPSGMVVHPGAGNKSGTLAQELVSRGTELSDASGAQRPGIVHRLDKDTSGLLIVAKNNQAHRALQEQFAARTVSKTYLALVRGRVEYEQGHIFKSIGRDRRMRTRMTVSEDVRARQAQTYYKVRKRFRFYTLLEVKIATGRTHQIRVHMAHAGYPVAGDKIYGRTHDPMPRLGLHATAIEFVHPRTQKPMRFECAPPPEFNRMVKVAQEADRI